MAQTRQIGVQIFERYEGAVSPDWLRRIAELTLATEAGSSSDHRGRNVLGVVVADDELVRDLNRLHRGLDETTDVLSFAFDHEGEYHGEGVAPTEWSEGVEFVVPPGSDASLGEVIISYPQATRQAEASGWTADRELAQLLAHGILHLLGYDHMEPDEEAAMKAREAEVLAQVLDDD